MLSYQLLIKKTCYLFRNRPALSLQSFKLVDIINTFLKKASIELVRSGFFKTLSQFRYSLNYQGICFLDYTSPANYHMLNIYKIKFFHSGKTCANYFSFSFCCCCFFLFFNFSLTSSVQKIDMLEIPRTCLTRVSQEPFLF